MWLKELFTINYKSCKQVHSVFDKDNPNIFIGINDCGKSTILKAIGLLLAPKPHFNFSSEDRKKSDLSNARVLPHEVEQILNINSLPQVTYTGKEAIVIGRLILEDEDVSEENVSACTPHLQWFYQNRTDNDLWLMRVFDETSQTVIEYLKTQDFEEEGGPVRLYSQTAKNLKERSDQLGISAKDIQNENKKGRFKNAEIVSAIYSKYTLVPHWVEYLSKEDKDHFPIYNYLDWNISMEELQNVAKMAISNKINAHLELTSEFAKKNAKKAQDIVDRELDDFTKLFAKDFPNINGFKSNIVFTLESKLTDIFINKNNTDGDIHLDSQGDGVKRQIWFALIKWSALNSIDSKSKTKKFIWCFDEPETHLYPKAQRDFFEIIKETSKENIQSIISTHSTIFIDRSNFPLITKFELDCGYTKIASCSSIHDIFDALNIRNSDFLFYDKFIVVEGDTEEVLIPHLYKLYIGKTLAESGIQLINLGGKDKRQQNHSILTTLLKDFNKYNDKVIYVFDNDIVHDLTTSEQVTLKYFLIGNQDIEDSIKTKIWLQIIETELSAFDFQTGKNIIEEIKGNIPKAKKHDKKLPNNNKFYSVLKNTLKKKIPIDNRHQIDDALPSKGKAWGLLLASHICDIGDVDPKIKDAFDMLQINFSVSDLQNFNAK